MTGKMKILIPFLILMGGLAMMLMFLDMGDDKSKRESRPKTKLVDTKLVHLIDIPARISGFGRLASVQPIQLISEVSGKLEAGDISFQPAQSFVRGDLLLRIDNRQAILELKSTKSELLTTLATFLSEIRTDFPEEFYVWQKYFNQCSFETDLQDLPETKNQRIKLFLSRFNVYKLYFAARNLEIRVTKHYLYAPFDGSIVSTNQRVGSTARNGTLLGEIINLEQLEIEVPVTVQDVRWIDRERPVKLFSSETEGELTGRIDRIGKVIDQRTQTVQAFISVDNLSKSSILEGVFFQVDISGRNIEHAVKIPHRALYNENFVYLIKNGKLVSRRVEIVRKESNSVIINAGLNDGDTLVIEAMQGVFEGMSARPKANPNEVEVQHE